MTLKSKSKKNGYKEVDLTCTFSNKDTSYVVQGFYDGDGIYKIRFMPQQPGLWHYTTSSNVTELDRKKGNFHCTKATEDNHGMVGVSNVHNFKYADGKPYAPFGTTSYAWTQMADTLEEITLASLKKSSFNKVRMCVFPKNYELVREAPILFPFVLKEIKKDNKGKEVYIWDFDHFNPAFFQHLENRVHDLDRLGIQADLILFHPYDKGRWGFDALPNEVNTRYIRYLVARLAAYRNVWWSMANEWDYVKAKSLSDWDLLTKTVVHADPYRHLLSIHGATATYADYWKPEFTHVSIQDESPVQTIGAAAMLRNIYKKPVVCDEVGYEGNLKNRWGRYSPEEMTHLTWNGVMGGIYVTHGECYRDTAKAGQIFWAQGGALQGESWKRIAFLRKIVEQCPNALSMADVARDNTTTTAGKDYYLIYLGKEIHNAWLFDLPVKNDHYGKVKPGTKFKAEIIDTWDMTIKTDPQTFEVTEEKDYRVYDKDFKKVLLPLKPYLALRITAL